jgi:hypothetical protein
MVLARRGRMRFATEVKVAWYRQCSVLVLMICMDMLGAKASSIGIEALSLDFQRRI